MKEIRLCPCLTFQLYWNSSKIPDCVYACVSGSLLSSAQSMSLKYPPRNRSRSISLLLHLGSEVSISIRFGYFHPASSSPLAMKDKFGYQEIL